MLINNKRALAYIQVVHNIEPIVGADNIEKVHVLGWDLIAKKGEFKENDHCVYIEIDSKVSPNISAFSFLASKGYKIKTYNLKKFNVISQGIALPVTLFPKLVKLPVNTDVTEELGITYSVAEDNDRKEDLSNIGKKGKLRKFIAKHNKFFNGKFGKFLVGHKITNCFISFIACATYKSCNISVCFPSFVVKTDEERVQNMPSILTNKSKFIVTEKIDGTSSTYALERNKNNTFKFYVCSRNRNVTAEKETSTGGVYWAMAKKYEIEKYLTKYLQENPTVNHVVLQGESFGVALQDNPLRQATQDLRIFNLIDDVNGRYGSVEGSKIVESWGMKWVPIISTDYVLPDTVDELILAATGPSQINKDVLREGWVIRSLDGKISFKAVSTKYLLLKNK